MNSERATSDRLRIRRQGNQEGRFTRCILHFQKITFKWSSFDKIVGTFHCHSTCSVHHHWRPPVWLSFHPYFVCPSWCPLCSPHQSSHLPEAAIHRQHPRQSLVSQTPTRLEIPTRNGFTLSAYNTTPSTEQWKGISIALQNNVGLHCRLTCLVKLCCVKTNQSVHWQVNPVKSNHSGNKFSSQFMLICVDTPGNNLYFCKTFFNGQILARMIWSSTSLPK